MMDLPPYETTIYWSAEDKLFVAEVPELPGCMAHGNTRTAAAAAAEEAIRAWISAAHTARRPVPEPSGRRVGSGANIQFMG